MYRPTFRENVLSLKRLYTSTSLHGDTLWYDIFVNCSWVATRWHQYSTHFYTHTIHRTTQKEYTEQRKNLGRVRAVPRLCGFYPGICLTTEEKARKTLSQGSRRVPADTMKMHKHTRSNSKVMRLIFFLLYWQYCNLPTQTAVYLDPSSIPTCSVMPLQWFIVD